ncbi:hypothetical protein Goklo_020712, partial [Gossypium klotzschianum]|nr:hypothetical protein [Gossypium klotzschianum]
MIQSVGFVVKILKMYFMLLEIVLLREMIIAWRLWKNRNIFIFQDGFVLEKAGFAAVGGIVDDRGGAWILGFNKYLWNCSIFEVELWGILEGLSLLVELGYDSVLIHFDCLEAITTILEGSSEGSNSVL